MVADGMTRDLGLTPMLSEKQSIREAYRLGVYDVGSVQSDRPGLALAGGVIGADGGELLGHPAAADTEDDASTRERVDRGDEFGDDERMPVREHDDPEAEPHPFGPTGERGQHGERIEQRRVGIEQTARGTVRIRGRRTARQREMIAGPHRVKPETLGLVGQPIDQRGVSRRLHRSTHRQAEVAERDSETH